MGLPISIGILSWHSREVLVNTLTSYATNGLLDLVEDVTIFFQECTEEDKAIADQFGIGYIESSTNVGIGKAFVELAKNAKTENILILEHDWELIEEKEVVEDRLKSALHMLERGYKQVKLRHRANPGFPLFARMAYEGKELEHFDEGMGLVAPNLMASIHWVDNPEERFDQIYKEGEYFVTSSRWSNWTNNPCLLRVRSYLEYVTPFVGENWQLEANISKWWAEQHFPVAQGEGLFTHNDFEKYKDR